MKKSESIAKEPVLADAPALGSLGRRVKKKKAASKVPQSAALNRFFLHRAHQENPSPSSHIGIGSGERDLCSVARGRKVSNLGQLLAVADSFDAGDDLPAFSPRFPTGGPSRLLLNSSTVHLASCSTGQLICDYVCFRGRKEMASRGEEEETRSRWRLRENRKWKKNCSPPSLSLSLHSRR